ncbi:MAG TPA: DUF2442 domain-containing protein [Stellaceae bacterium]
MLHRIATAQARTDFTIAIAWDDGGNSTVSFADIVGRGVAAPLADPAYFVPNMAVSDGFALAWPGDVEFSADSLWYKAHPNDARREIEAAE